MRAIVLLLVCSLSAVAPAAAAKPAEDAAQARALYQVAITHYNLGEYQAALTAFALAYHSKPDAAFLFNIAQCYRALARFDEAAREYRAYLRESPKASNRGEAERLIGEMDRLAVTRPSAAAASGLSSFDATPALTTVEEHQLLSIHLVARTAEGAKLTGYSGVPVLSGDWGDLKVISQPVFASGEAEATVWLNRETNPTDGLAHVKVADGNAHGSTTGLTVKAPKWTVTNATAVFAPAPAGEWDEGSLSAISWLRVGGGYVLWYAAEAANSLHSAIGRASSPDGIIWTRTAGNPLLSRSAAAWERTGVRSPSVVHDGTQFIMLYAGYSFQNTNESGAVLVKSSDGITWTRLNYSPILAKNAVAACPDMSEPKLVLESPNNYRVFFTSANGPCTMASSDGGLSWPTAKVAAMSGLGGSDRVIAAVVKEGTIYRLWSTSGSFYATSADGVKWAPSPANPGDVAPAAVRWNDDLVKYEALIALPDNAGFGRATRP